jgi:hypothetical protein
MNQILTTENGKFYSVSRNFNHPPSVPARQVGGKRKAPHRRITYLNLPLLQQDLVECESDLERDLALIVALNPDVTRIEHQPETFDLGEFGEYTPDFRVSYKNKRSSYLEAKPEIFAKEPDTWAKLTAAYRYLKSQNIVFEYVSDRDIEKHNRNLNAAYIHCCAKLAVPLEQSQKIIETASNYPQGIRMDDLQAITGLLTDHILHCVGIRQLKLNHFFEFKPESMVYPLQGECK